MMVPAAFLALATHTISIPTIVITAKHAFPHAQHAAKVMALLVNRVLIQNTILTVTTVIIVSLASRHAKLATKMMENFAVFILSTILR